MAIAPRPDILRAPSARREGHGIIEPVQHRGTLRRRQFVFAAFGRGVVLDHPPRLWERIVLRLRLLLRPGPSPLRLDDQAWLAGPDGPHFGGPAGAGNRVPRRPPDEPLVGAIALLEPFDGTEADPDL